MVDIAGRYLPADMVAGHGYKAQPVRVSFNTWLALTDKAVELVERAVESGRGWAELSTTEHNAWGWLAGRYGVGWPDGVE